MIDKASFRDPSGYVYHTEEGVFRKINIRYKTHYDLLISSGLYQQLVDNEWLVQHEEINHKNDFTESFYKVIKPELIPFISYPYEWCFSQLKDAAILTLEIQKTALKFNMSLKDASAYNIQFLRGKPVLIDTLSFEKYNENQPWQAYKQFCEFFLGPLSLMSFVDHRTVLLLKNFINGIPLDLISNLLPFYAKLKIGIYLHLILHSKYNNRYTFDKKNDHFIKSGSLSKKSLIHLIENLLNTVKDLQLCKYKTEWFEYYEIGVANDDYLVHKETIISDFVRFVNPSFVYDIGANDGKFSRLEALRNSNVISIDSDWRCVEENYNCAKKSGLKNLLSLFIDVTNPSPGLGWSNNERKSFFNCNEQLFSFTNTRVLITDSTVCHLTLALALIHHLVITNNIPLEKISEFFALNTDWLIIEFVPKEDEKVKFLLRNREDIFFEYSDIGFEFAFRKHFTILNCIKVNGTSRSMYLMRKIK